MKTTMRGLPAFAISWNAVDAAGTRVSHTIVEIKNSCRCRSVGARSHGLRNGKDLGTIAESIKLIE